MASNYPSGLDSFTNPAGTDNLAAGIGHAAQHANANDAIEAIESTLGLNPQGASATVKARLDAIEANSWVTSARIADGTITGTDIASGTVAAANLADGAITPIKTSGGYVAKTALYTATNDDRIIDCTTGTYTITLPTAASQAGRRFVIRNSGTGVITIGRTGAETIAGATSQTLAGYGHLEVISNGTNWLVIRGTYADETVGRRIFTWNPAYSSGSGGWQMTTGDSGWRDISSLVASVGTRTVTNIRCRRIMNSVHFMQQITDTQTNPSSQSLVTMPTGFGSQSTKHFAMYSSSVNVRRLGVFSDSTVVYTGTTDANRYDCEVSWITTEAWPSSLPGSAVGSIPT